MSFKLNPLLGTDGYKVGHHKMYNPRTTMVYSNYTCRSTKKNARKCTRCCCIWSTVCF